MVESLKSIIGRQVGLDKDENLVLGGYGIYIGHKDKADLFVDLAQLNASNGVVTTVAPTGDLTGAKDRHAIQNAANALHNLGGGLLQLQAGIYYLDATAIRPADKVTIRGAGMGVTVLQQTIAGVRAFDLPGTSNGTYLAFIDFTVNGTWQTNQSLGTDSDRCFAIGGITRVLFQNIECTNCRQMSITCGFGEEVTVSGCRIQNSARDCINLSSTKRCIVVSNFIRNGNDDAIAIHQEAVDGNPPHEGHVIANNQIEDTCGIKMLGASKAIIANNILRRVKAYGIYTTPGGSEGYSDQIAINIIGNIITDIISPNLYVPGGGGSQIAIGIYVGNATQGLSAPVVGGTPPQINLPENVYYQSNSASAPNTGAQGINIVGNIIYGFTLPAAVYSTWGFGQMFYSSGYINPDLSSGWKYSVQGIRFAGAILDANVSDNHFIGLNTSILCESTITFIDDITIRNNKFKRFSQAGISFETAATKYGRVQIESNDFDADPYFEHANRTSPLDGTWNASAFIPCAIDIVRYLGYVVRGNVFRNVITVNHFGAGGTATYSGNTYYMQPDSGATVASSNNSANRGIREPDGFGTLGDILVVEDSDPTSATYGHEIGRSFHSAAAMPTSGSWMTGMFVKNTSITESGSTPNKYTVDGWSRLTTGTANVLNTDWREMRCLTGN
jgi:hypothetical protein